MLRINNDSQIFALQAVASNSMLHHDRTAWLADAAPEPRDVIWSNLGQASDWLCACDRACICNPMGPDTAVLRRGLSTLGLGTECK